MIAEKNLTLTFPCGKDEYLHVSVDISVEAGPGDKVLILSNDEVRIGDWDGQVSPKVVAYKIISKQEYEALAKRVTGSYSSTLEN